MATVVDSLLISFGMDAKGIDQGVKRAESSIAAGVKTITNLLAPLVGGFAFKSLLDSYVRTADQLGKAAGRMGVDVEALHAWGQAAQHAGGSAEAFQASLESLNSQLQLVATTGKSRITPFLEKMGIQAKDSAGKVRQPFEILEDLAKKAGSMGKSEFAGMARRMGLDRGTIGLLQQGGDEVQKLVERMRRFSFTQEDSDAAAEYKDVLQDVQAAFRKIASLVMRSVVPALSSLLKEFSDFMTGVKDNRAKIVTGFAAVAAVVGSKVVPALKNLDAVWAKSKAAMTVAALVAAFSALYLVADDFFTYCRGGDSALEELWALFGTGEEISAWLSETWEELKTTGTELFDALKTAAATFMEYFGGAVAPLKAAFKELFSLLKALFTGDFEGILNHAVALLSDLAKVVLTVLSGAFEAAVDAAIAVFSTLWDRLTELFSQIGDAVVGTVKSVVNMLPDFLKPDALKAWAEEADEAARTKGAELAGAGPEASELVQAAGAGGSTTNVDARSETTNNVEVNVYVPPGADGSLIGMEAAGAFSRSLVKTADGPTGGAGR